MTEKYIIEYEKCQQIEGCNCSEVVATFDAIKAMCDDKPDRIKYFLDKLEDLD